jgi:fatty acid desaturase
VNRDCAESGKLTHVFGTSVRSPAHAWISTRLVAETLLVYVGLCAASAWALAQDGGARLLAPPLLLALGLWLDRMYTVGHEAAHRKLFPDHLGLNDLVGAVVLAPLLAPLSVFRKIHRFHHGQNRRAPGVSTLDVVVLPPGPPWRRRLARAWGWTTWLLAVFAGGFFLHSLVSVVLFLLLPTAVARRISPAFHGWRARDRARAWAELLAGVAVHLLVWRLGGAALWLACLGLPILAFAWVYSLLLYIYHYRTTIGGDIRYNVRSLRRNRVLAWVLLNFNEHTTHHADPRLPWYLLPQRRIAAPPEYAANQQVDTIFAAILQQLRGPTFVERAPESA